MTTWEEWRLNLTKKALRVGCLVCCLQRGMISWTSSTVVNYQEIRPPQGSFTFENYNVLIPSCRSEYFQTLKHCFFLLFSKDWLSLEVPDLYSVLVSQPHIKIDSPTTDEEIQKILNRFSQASLTSSGHHMTHAQIYSAILDVIIQVREEREEKLIILIRQHCRRESTTWRRSDCSPTWRGTWSAWGGWELAVRSLSHLTSRYRERERLLRLVSVSPRLTTLEVGCAADDTILWQVGQTCPALRSLKFGGNQVTDRGVYWLIGGGRLSKDDLQCPLRFQSEGEKTVERAPGRTPLCSSLCQLDLARALMVTEAAVSHCWTNLSNLVHFNIQESHLWLLLKKIKKSEDWADFVIPLKRLEITTHCTQVRQPHTSQSHTSPHHMQDYLTPATWVFPRLEELVIWNFETDQPQSPFSAAVQWKTFACLHSLRLNNVLFSDLTTILAVIGSQILLLDIDNFSLRIPLG